MQQHSRVNRCALIVLYDEARHYLLQLRSKNAPRIPGYWGFFGGGIKAGEAPLDAVQREAAEELGYTLQDPSLILKQEFFLTSDHQSVVHGTEHGVMWAYAEFYGGSKKDLILAEGADMAWIAAKESRSLMMLEHDRTVIWTLDKILSKAQAAAPTQTPG